MAGSAFIEIEPGTQLLLRRDDEDQRDVVVVQVKYGLIWISRTAEPGEDGERVLVEHAVPGDGLYVAPARVENVLPGTYALRRVGDWERKQRREHVRIRTSGIEAELVRTETPGTSDLEATRATVEDLSAGGLQARTDANIQVGEQLVCSFALSDGRSFEVPAKVVRARSSRTGSSVRLGLEFVEMSESVRSELLGWVLQEHTQRHRRIRRERDDS